jgi:hypothetical protein
LHQRRARNIQGTGSVRAHVHKRLTKKPIRLAGRLALITVPRIVARDEIVEVRALERVFLEGEVLVRMLLD